MDVDTGSVNLVGQIGEGRHIAGIAFDTGGILYGLNLSDNSLYIIDQDNANLTLIGPVGYNLGGIQDIAFDRENNLLYGTLFDADTGTGGLYVFNRANGACILLNDFKARVAALAIPFKYTEAFAGGSGTKEDPYQVATAAQLNSVRAFGNAHFLQVADIDLGVPPWNSGAGWQPIGDTLNPFNGSFNGNGFEITGLTIKKPYQDYVGLFGSCGSTELSNIILTELSNIILKDVAVEGKNYTGGLVGFIQGPVIDSSSSGNVTGAEFVGGLVGFSFVGPGISGSHSSAQVTGIQKLGGLAGGTYANIVSSYATGDVNQLRAVFWLCCDQGIGGLVGSATELVADCYATGNVGNLTEGMGHVGGLIGAVWGEGNAVIERSFETGAVTTSGRGGGLIGFLFLGEIVKNCYSTGAVQGGNMEDAVGSLIGAVGSGIVQNCYATGQIMPVQSAHDIYNSSQEGQGNYYLNYVQDHKAQNINAGNKSKLIVSLSLNESSALNEAKVLLTRFFTDELNLQIDQSLFFDHKQKYGAPSDYGMNYSIAVLVENLDHAVLQSDHLKDLQSVGRATITIAPLGSNYSPIGGLVGENKDTIINSYYDYQSTGQSDTGKGIPKSTAEMLSGYPSEEIFNRWDNAIWTFSETDQYPHLAPDPAPGSYPEQPPLPEGNFSGGLGTPESPYQIVTAAQLSDIRYKPDAHYIQVADINLADLLWEPIGTRLVPFNGCYDGNGFEISNLVPYEAHLNYRGLFGFTGENALIKNVNLKEVTVNGMFYAGGLVGRNFGSIEGSSVSGTISGLENVGGLAGASGDSWVWPRIKAYINDCHSSVEVRGVINIGGLAGSACGYIENSSSYGLVEMTRPPFFEFFGYSGWSIGGLIGTHFSGTIANCFTDIEVIGINTFGANCSIGGLVGRGFDFIITECNTAGNVISKYIFCTGGLVGIADGNYVCNPAEPVFSSINRSYSSGFVKGSDMVGGLVGFNTVENTINDSFSVGDVYGSERQGGLVGLNRGGILRSYAVGQILGDGEESGGLVGFNEGTIVNCYYDQDTTGQNDTGKGIPKTRAEMHTGYPSPEIYTDWSEEIWTFNPADSYPWLDEPYYIILITTEVYPDGFGEISGGGLYWLNSDVVIKAEARAGYSFFKWTEDGEEISNEAQLTFIAESDRSLTAHFKYSSELQTLGDLAIGDRVVDPSWEWEHRTGRDYSGQGESKPVTWIVVAKDHYGADSGVTLLSDELVARHSFDNSTDRNDFWPEGGCNHWGESGTGNATRGLRPWLNSTGIHNGEGFYSVFSESFKEKVITTTVPNKVRETGVQYNTQDKVFIPSTTELGDLEHNYTFEIGTVYAYFIGSINQDRIAKLGGDDRAYFTRSPVLNCTSDLRLVTESGGDDYVSWASDNRYGVRPALNLKSETLVSGNKNPDEVYEIIIMDESHKFSIFVFANPSLGGTATVSGDGTFKAGDIVTITATANEGYDFVNWTENGTVVSTAPVYKFTVTADRNLTANFQATASAQKVIYVQNQNTGAVDAWVVEADPSDIKNSRISNKVNIGIAPSPSASWMVTAVHDIDNSGSPDLIWHNSVSGQRTVWMMDGLNKILELPYGDQGHPNLIIVDLHDMTGNGKPDAILRNLAGAIFIWEMDEHQRQFEIRSGFTNPNWNLVGVNDMGNDGNTNYIWEHNLVGSRNYWVLDEMYRRDSGGEFYSTGDYWKIVAVHDMDGDGNPDMIWEHRGNGNRAIWCIDTWPPPQEVELDNWINPSRRGSFAQEPTEWIIVGAGTVYQ